MKYILLYQPPCGTWYVHSHKLYDTYEKALAARNKFLLPEVPYRIVPFKLDSYTQPPVEYI